MNKLIVCAVLAAFAVVPALQAGDGKDAKTKAVSAAKASATCADKAGATCADKDKTAQAACGTACCDKEKLTRKAVKPAEKGGMLLAKR